MIRMGRNSRDEAETGDASPNADQSYRYGQEAPASSGRAISESDAMARDIKEGRLSGFVGHGTTLTGETQFQAMLRVDGHLVGTVSSDSGTLLVGTNGQVDANIAVATAVINGAVTGDISATEKLQLGRTARVVGNIQAPRLIIEEGAILEGSCSMLNALDSRQEAASAAEGSRQEVASTYSGFNYDAADDEADEEQINLLEDEEQEDASAETARA